MMPPLTGRLLVSRGGRIIGLLDKLSILHSTSADAWKTLWKSMHENGILWPISSGPMLQKHGPCSDQLEKH